MSFIELLFIAVGLAMDAFAVSICKGLSVKKINWTHAAKAGIYFGGFQASMPIIGYLLGSQFKETIVSIDHWIAFLLLSIIGYHMIREALCKDISEDEPCDDSFSAKDMVVLAFATSIDALAVGVTFAFLQVDIISAASVIGIVTLVLSIIGVRVGNVFGNKYKSKAEFTGGLILILMGVKILLQHLF